MPRIRIVVRTNTDWSTMDASRFAAQSDPTLPVFQIKGSAQRDLFGVWNHAFGVDFFRYRAELQEIARESYKRVHGALITTGLDDFEDWLLSPDEEIIVPTDDDDFFHPGLAKILEAFQVETDVVIWPYLTMGYTSLAHARDAPPSRRGVQFLAFKILFSNNWAIRKTYLARFGAKKARLMIAHHNKANEIIANDLRIPTDGTRFLNSCELHHSRVTFIRDMLSLYNAHVGSIFLLLQVLMSEDPVRLLTSLDHETALVVPPYAKAFESDIRRVEVLTRTLVRPA